MSTINNEDLFLVNRGEISYKVTAEDVRKHTNGLANVREFIAKGTIPNGMAVAVNNDGTVSLTQVESISSKVRVDPVFGYGTALTYDSANDKVIAAYRSDSSNSYQGQARVGTISGDTISFGNSVIFCPTQVNEVTAVYDSANNKVVIVYQDKDNNRSGTAIVGNVVADTINFGTPVVFKSSPTKYISATFDSTNNKVIIVYCDEDDSGKGESSCRNRIWNQH